MKNKLAKWKPYIFLAVLLASLVPLVWLGRYNYPTGDDYYYGTEAHLVWQQNGSIPQAISGSRQGASYKRLTLPAQVSQTAIRSGREPIQRCF